MEAKTNAPGRSGAYRRKPPALRLAKSHPSCLELAAKTSVAMTV